MTGEIITLTLGQFIEFAILLVYCDKSLNTALPNKTNDGSNHSQLSTGHFMNQRQNNMHKPNRAPASVSLLFFFLPFFKYSRLNNSIYFADFLQIPLCYYLCNCLKKRKGCLPKLEKTTNAKVTCGRGKTMQAPPSALPRLMKMLFSYS